MSTTRRDIALDGVPFLIHVETADDERMEHRVVAELVDLSDRKLRALVAVPFGCVPKRTVRQALTDAAVRLRLAGRGDPGLGLQVVGPVVARGNALEQARRPQRTTVACNLTICGEPAGGHRHVDGRDRLNGGLAAHSGGSEHQKRETAREASHQTLHSFLNASAATGSAHAYNLLTWVASIRCSQWSCSSPSLSARL